MARSQRYLEHVLSLLKAAKQKGLLTDADLDRIVRSARGRAGGEARAERARAATSVAADDYGMAPAYVPVAVAPDDDDDETPDLDDIADAFAMLEIEGSFQDSIEDVSEALTAAYGDSAACTVVATFPDRVIYVTVDPDEDGEVVLYSQEYTTDDNGTVTLGARTEVGLEAGSFVPQPDDAPALADDPQPPTNLSPKQTATWRKFYANALKTCTNTDPAVCKQKAKAAADKMVGNVKASDAAPVVRFARRVLDAVFGGVQLADTTDKPWDGSAARFDSSEAYCKSCLVDENPAGKPKVQSNCHLPVREPDGTVNLNALRAAASAIGGGRNGSPPPYAAKAKRALEPLLKQYKIGDYAESGGTKASDWDADPSAVALADPAPYFTVAAVRLADMGNGSLPAWQQVHRIDTWAVPHASGQQIQLTRGMGDTMIRNFHANVIRRGVPLDEIHLTDQGGRALGWLLDLRWGDECQGLPGLPEPDGSGPVLYGRFRYNRLGQEMLSDEHYKYLSPQYHHNYVDKQTGREYGPTIVAVGATNNPFLRQRSIQGEAAPPVAVLSDGLVRPQQQEAPVNGQNANPNPTPAPQNVVSLDEWNRLQTQLADERRERHEERVTALFDVECSKPQALEPRYRRLLEPLMKTAHPKQEGTIRLADAAEGASPLNIYQLCEALLKELPRVSTGRTTLADDTRPGEGAAQEPTPEDLIKRGQELYRRYAGQANGNGAVAVPAAES